MSPCDIAATIHLYKILFVHNCFFDVERRHLRLIHTALGLMIMAGNIFSVTVLTPVSRVAVVARARLHSGSGHNTTLLSGSRDIIGILRYFSQYAEKATAS